MYNSSMVEVTLEQESASFQNYSGSANILAGFVETICGLKLHQNTRNKWRYLMESMRVADDLIDSKSTHIARDKLYTYVIENLRNQPNSTKEDMEADRVIDIIKQKLLSDLPINQKILFITNLKSLFRITEKLKTEENGKKLATLTRLEGQLTARMLLLVLPKENSSRAVTIAITRFCRFANNVDSAIDMPMDHRGGKTKCDSTISNRFTMLVAAVPDIISSVKHLKPGPKQILQMVDSGFKTVQGRNNQ